MRISRSASLVGLLIILGACSGGASPSSGDPVEAELPSAAATPPQQPSEVGIGAFAGAFDAATKSFEIRTRDSGSGLKAQATLPYGNVSGAVYFKTCSVSYNATTHILQGTVQAVNLTGATVYGLTAVVDSLAPSGVTLASGPGSGASTGVIANYGDVAPNTGNCASTLTWQFSNPTDGQFGFEGHADGILRRSGVSCASILAAYPGSPTGLYYDITGGGASVPAYCDMTTAGGGWTMVYDQNTASGYQSRATWTAGVNTSSPNGGQYSILNRLAGLKSGTNYEFWLNWPVATKYIRWSQTQNPFSVTTPGAVTLQGVTSASPTNQQGGTNVPFVGLYATQTAPNATLCGDANNGYYWFAVGEVAAYQSGIPAYSNSASGGPLVTSRVALYVR